MSTIGEKLTASKNALDNLLTYANTTTGVEDTNIGDAIKTLCDGYGHGSGGNILEFVEGIGDVVPDAYIENGNEVAYSGWSISKYYPATYMDKFIVNSDFTFSYCAVYDESFNYVEKPLFNDGFFFIRTANATYIRFSGTTTEINSLKAIRYKGE